ncbi:MAG: tetratricopeptide repeat protein [Bdellovibrionaceae bacterium]|nr:tetratricopeptide repeat protein [Pseudobdellovibrionaceae bacterium]
MVRILLIFSLFITVGCASWREKDSEKAELYLKMGASQFENGNYPAAMSALLQAEKLDDKNPVIQNTLGITYFARQRNELAEKHIRRAIELDKNYTEARNNLARVLIQVGKYDEAEKEIRIVLNDLTYPAIDKAYINLGLAQFNQKHFAESKESFLRAMNATRDNCVANTYYGRSIFEMKDYEKAAPALDNAIGFCQKILFDEPHYYSALTYYRLGQKDRSVARFEEIIRFYPEGKFRDKAKAMLALIRKTD